MNIKSERAPLIGITMRYDAEGERLYLARSYAEAVRAAGGAPVHIPLIPERDYIRDLVGRCSGVVLPGSASDVDPRLYGHDPHRNLGTVHTLRDETDRLVLEAAEESGVPLLAICYGMQAWNVWRGGTLVQDIATEVPQSIKHEQGAPRDRRSHKIRLAPDGRLADCAADKAEDYVNSSHHQALNTLGRNLRAVAWSPDGLVEAIEDTSEGGAWAVGVQWHPEIAWQQDELSTNLFSAFVAAARAYESNSRRDALDAETDSSLVESLYS